MPFECIFETKFDIELGIGPEIDIYLFTPYDEFKLTYVLPDFENSVRFELGAAWAVISNVKVKNFDYNTYICMYSFFAD